MSIIMTIIAVVSCLIYFYDYTFAQILLQIYRKKYIYTYAQQIEDNKYSFIDSKGDEYVFTIEQSFKESLSNETTPDSDVFNNINEDEMPELEHYDEVKENETEDEEYEYNEILDCDKNNTSQIYIKYEKKNPLNVQECNLDDDSQTVLKYKKQVKKIDKICIIVFLISMILSVLLDTFLG